MKEIINDVLKEDNDDFLKFLQDRFSCREYKSDPVDDNLIRKIVKAAYIAPSACNNQPIRIYALKSADALKKINNLSKCIYKAPLVFLICYDKNECWHSKINEGFHSGVIDASIAACHMMLEAHHLGLGTLWVGLFDKQKTKEEFNLPKSEEPIALLDVGYRQDGAKALALHDTFRPLKEIYKEF